MSATTADTHRLFFALWPDGQTREALGKLQQDLPLRGGRPMRRENIHLTLAFIGNVDTDVRDCLIAQARQVTGPAVELPIERVGHFARPRVLWVGPQRTPDSLIDLVGRLNRALLPCGYEAERRPFRAHVTLFRKVARPPKPFDFEPLAWRAPAFQLVESIPEPGGVRYAVIEEFPLAG